MGWKTCIVLGTMFYTALAIYFVKSAHSDDWTLQGGPAILDGSTSGESKLFGLREDKEILMGIYHSVGFGGWVDSRPGMNSSLYTKTQLGVQPGSKTGIFAKAFLGPALISKTDNTLGGHFQFSEDVGLGVRDKDTMVSFTYTHFSSAGISKPNRGRDFVTFELGLVW